MTTKVPLSQLTDRSVILTSGREKPLTFSGPISWQSITWTQLIRTSCLSQPNPTPLLIWLSSLFHPKPKLFLCAPTGSSLHIYLHHFLHSLSHPHHHFHYYSVCIQHCTSFHLIKHHWFGWRLVGKTGPITSRARLSVRTLVFLRHQINTK